ncbi:hypothetical protein BDW66DRAFT_126844 [Aspergillus desertorum]
MADLIVNKVSPSLSALSMKKDMAETMGIIKSSNQRGLSMIVEQSLLQLVHGSISEA